MLAALALYFDRAVGNLNIHMRLIPSWGLQLFPEQT